jgi:L-amino acid N-acyltransferase YncA
MSYTLEPMTEKHRKPVIDIFNYYIETNFAFPETKVDYDFFDHFLDMSKGYPALVAKAESGDVVGFALLHQYSWANSFKRSALITYFILPQHTRKGLGKMMLDKLIAQARSMGVDHLLANISSDNERSLQFHRKHGFHECGRFQEVGRRFGKSFDVVWMIRRI